MRLFSTGVGGRSIYPYRKQVATRFVTSIQKQQAETKEQVPGRFNNVKQSKIPNLRFVILDALTNDNISLNVIIFY